MEHSSTASKSPHFKGDRCSHSRRPSRWVRGTPRGDQGYTLLVELPTPDTQARRSRGVSVTSHHSVRTGEALERTVRLWELKSSQETAVHRQKRCAVSLSNHFTIDQYIK
ncbi:hypothetical protein FKM82_026682 [Ascaphus truei]